MRLDECGVDASAVLEAASESILITSADLDRPGPTIVYVNPTFERMTGWAARAEAFIEHHVAALRTERHLHGIGENIDAPQHSIASV